MTAARGETFGFFGIQITGALATPGLDGIETLNSQRRWATTDECEDSRSETPVPTERQQAVVAEQELTDFAPPEQEQIPQITSTALMAPTEECTDSAEKISAGQASDIVTAPTSGDTKITRSDLVSVLESFVTLIKNSDDISGHKKELWRSESRFHSSRRLLSPQRLTCGARRRHKTLEVDELRCLLVEAQETIIRLLTDRVEDRAKIAQLETELKLLPGICKLKPIAPSQ